MKVFAYGYSASHGLMDHGQTDALTRQNDMVLRALIADLSAVPGIEVITLRDPHAPALELPESVLVVPCDRPFDRRFGDCVRLADAVWPIAPESFGLLERLSRKVMRSKRVLLGSTPAAVRLTSSKLLTARALAKADIPVVDTYLPDDALPDAPGAWVVKPADGAGCMDTHIFNSVQNALEWIRGFGQIDAVLQPFMSGKPCSISMLCCAGTARVLSVNEHRIAVLNNQFHDLGCTVNSMPDETGELAQLASAVARAIPGLWGCVGVDFIMTGRGAVVLEVNPRLTTAYIGLQASIGCNPAALVLGLLQGAMSADLPVFEKGVVSIDTGVFSACA